MLRRFRQVDVFGSTAFSGNPLAVVHGADDLTDGEMQRFTRWTNLSETAFLVSPTTSEADYRVRIFTLSGELPFAGHPTLGSCHAWLEHGGEPADRERVVQECGAGLVTLTRRGEGLAFAAPPLVRTGSVDPALMSQLARSAGIRAGSVVDAQWVDNGPGWVALLLPGADDVLAARPEARVEEGSHLDVGLVGMYPDGNECAYEIRGLFSDQAGSIREDPVTGSLNASVAQWLLATGRVTAPYLVSQGSCVGADGRVHIDYHDDTVWVGGNTATVVRGEVEI